MWTRFPTLRNFIGTRDSGIQVSELALGQSQPHWLDLRLASAAAVPDVEVRVLAQRRRLVLASG